MNDTARARPRDWFGQPPGLTILFLTEMWEKFSYFGMRALLVYYMTRHLLLEQGTASFVYGAYTAFVYFTPIIGGAISDRWLGRRKAVVIGGSIMAIGHFMMISEALFFPALAVIAIGNGLYLPSLPSQIVRLYGEDDPRRGSAYSVYYVGVNAGGFLAPLICGTLGEIYGWHWGFSAAGLGMLAGLSIYLAGSRYLPPESPVPTLVRATAPQAEPALLPRFALLTAIAFVVVIFRAAYEQLGNTVALWAADVDRHVGSFVIPMTWFQSLNPLIVFLLTPVVVARWTRLAERGSEPSPLTKMATGACIVAASYGMLAAVSLWTEANAAQVSWLWLASFFVVITTGELYIVPIGLGLFGRLAPPRLAATTIATWFLAAFLGNLLAGALGTLWSHLSKAEFFGLVGAVAAASAVLLRLLDHPAQRVTRPGASELSAATQTPSVHLAVER